MGHTPGPWEVRQRADGSRGITGSYHIPEGQPAFVGGWLHVCDLSGDEHHDEANARLIAAAPELLKLVMDVERLTRDDAVSAEALEIARHALNAECLAAIRKAIA